MAELFLKVGDQGLSDDLFKDGDIISAYNNRRICCHHMQIICHIKNVAFNSDGLNPTNSLPEKMRLHCFKYKFQRVSVNEVLRTNQWTLETDLVSNVPNAFGEHIYVQEYIERAKKFSRHQIFGKSGSEIWYGGRHDWSQTKLDLVWAEIEKMTGYRKADHTMLNLGDEVCKVHLVLKLSEDITDTEAAEMAAPEYDNNEEEILKKRSKYVEIDNLDLSQASISLQDIRDSKKIVDVRSEVAYSKSIVKTKLLSVSVK